MFSLGKFTPLVKGNLIFIQTIVIKRESMMWESSRGLMEEETKRILRRSRAHANSEAASFD